MVKRTIAVGDFVAELYYDPKSDPPLFHYIVTRRDSAEILAWGQEYTLDAAERAALERATLQVKATKAAG